MHAAPVDLVKLFELFVDFKLESDAARKKEDRLEGLQHKVHGFDEKAPASKGPIVVAHVSDKDATAPCYFVVPREMINSVDIQLLAKWHQGDVDCEALTAWKRAYARFCIPVERRLTLTYEQEEENMLNLITDGSRPFLIHTASPSVAVTEQKPQEKAGSNNVVDYDPREKEGDGPIVVINFHSNYAENCYFVIPRAAVTFDWRCRLAGLHGRRTSGSGYSAWIATPAIAKCRISFEQAGRTLIADGSRTFVLFS